MHEDVAVQAVKHLTLLADANVLDLIIHFLEIHLVRVRNISVLTPIVSESNVIILTNIESQRSGLISLTIFDNTTVIDPLHWQFFIASIALQAHLRLLLFWIILKFQTLVV